MKNGKNPKERRGFFGAMYNISTNTKYNTVKSQEKARFPLMTVLAAITATALFMIIVFSFMQISQVKVDIAEINSAVHTLQKQERKISTELDGKYSSKIEALAADMGLSKTGSGAVYFTNNDKMEVTEVISPEKDSPSTINTLMSAVSRSFRKFLEFME